MNSDEFNKLLRGLKTKVSAFNRIYTFYFPKIVLHIYSKYKSKSLGEDVAQEFFAKLIKMQIEDYINSPTGWVYAIADNIAKNIILKEKRYCQESLDAAAVYVNDIFEHDVYGEYSEKLKMLEDDTHEILVLHIWEGYSLKEIADMKKVKHGTIRQKYSRGIKKLKKL